MRKRVKLTPFVYFGPVAFVPMVIIGVFLDMFIMQTNGGFCTIALSLLGLVFYLISLAMSVFALKTEKKAQEKAIALMKTDGIATDEESEMSRKLFRLYNIEYINDMVIALLELIYRVLQIVAAAQNASSVDD